MHKIRIQYTEYTKHVLKINLSSHLKPKLIRASLIELLMICEQKDIAKLFDQFLSVKDF